MDHHHRHDRAAIAQRLAEGHQPSYLRDFVYGGIDGVVTTFAIVAGVEGATLSSHIVLILGLANVIADGFSMAASNYSGTKTVLDDIARIREIEAEHIRLYPDGEREEVRQLLALKGLEGETLEKAVDAITADKDRWIELMLTEEYGLSLNQPSPMRAAWVTFVAFLACGIMPLLPFALGLENSFLISSIFAACVFFAIGAAKSIWALAPWWRSGLETLFIGGAAASLSYFVGYLLRGFA